MSTQVRSLLAAMATIIMWASAFPFTRFLLEQYSPGAIMVLRFSLASIILIVISIIKKIKLPKVKDLPMFFAFGIVGVFAYSFFFNTGSSYVVAGVSSFIVSSAPVFTIILARIFLKEIIKPAAWFGVAISFSGLMVVMLSQTGRVSLNVGVLLLVGAAICASVLNITQRILVRKYTALEATTYAMIIGTIFMFIYLPEGIAEFRESTLPANLALIYLAIFPAVLAYITWGYALSKVEKTTQVTVFIYLIPFLSSLIGFFWLGETFSIWSLLGGVIIIGGMVLTNIFGRASTPFSK